MPWKVKYEFDARPAQVARYLHENTHRIPPTRLHAPVEGVHAQPTGSERTWRLFYIQRGKGIVRPNEFVPCLYVKLSEHDRRTTVRGFWFVIPSFLIAALVWFLFVFVMVSVGWIPLFSLGSLFLWLAPILIYAMLAIPDIRNNKHIYQVLDECQAEMSRRRQPVKSKAGRARHTPKRRLPDAAAPDPAP